MGVNTRNIISAEVLGVVFLKRLLTIIQVLLLDGRKHKKIYKYCMYVFKEFYDKKPVIISYVSVMSVNTSKNLIW